MLFLRSPPLQTPSKSRRALLYRAAFLAAFACVAMAAPAAAELEICNETDLRQSVAIGYKGATDWTSEGWWNIAPGDCVTPVTGKLVKRYYYYHARSDGGGFRGQNYMFCTQGKEFTITGDTDCKGRGFEPSEFREIDTGETATSFTLTLVDADGAPGPVTGSSGPGGGSRQIAALVPTPAVTEPPLPGDVSDAPGEDALVDVGHDTGVAPAPEDDGIVQSVNELPRTPDLDVRSNDLTTELPPGEHGTPFSVPALFQGCELEGGRAYCSFHNEGVKMRAFHSGPTPDALFYALEEMPLNTAVMLTGDQADLRDDHAAVVIRAVQLRPGSDPHARLRQALQGNWETTDDPQTEITIRGSEIYERRRGVFKSARFLTLADRCAGLRGNGPVMLQSAPGNARVDCFVLAKADGRRLELAPVRGGPVISYRRTR